jgi:porin
MLADSQFLQSKTAATFINNGISWPDFLSANLPSSGPAFPLPAPGIRVRIKPRDDVQLQAAVFSGDPRGADGSNQPAPLPTGSAFSFSGGAFFIAEASYLPNQGKDAAGLPGVYRIGAWYHTSARFADQRYDNTGLSLASPQSTGIPMEHAGDGGVYGVLDQMLYRVAGTDDQGLSGFFRAGGVPNDRNLVNFYADGGFAYKGLVPHRPEDKIGVAAAVARVRLGCRIFLGQAVLSGAQQRSGYRAHLSAATQAMVDVAAGSAIRHQPRRRRPQCRWQPQKKRLGRRRPLIFEFLSVACGLSRCLRRAVFGGANADV